MNIIYIKKRRKSILDLEEDQNLGTPTATQNSGVWTLGNYGGYNAVIAMDIVFPSTPSDGCAAEKGGTGTGLWVGLRDSGTVFRVRGFSGGSLNTNTTVWVDITDFPTDGNTHTVVIEIRRFPARIRVWIDGVFKGEDNMGNPQVLSSWEGGASGSFLSGENVGVNYEPTGAWPSGTTGQIRLYQHAMITYNVPDPITDQLVLDIDPRDSNSYPGSGSTIYDLTSNDYDGVLSGGAFYENTSTYGQCIRVTGVDEYIDFSSAPQFTTSSFSISCWFWGASSQPDGYATLVSKEGSSNLGNYSFIGDANSSYVRFGFHDGSNNQEVSSSGYYDLKNNRWVNYTGVFRYNISIPLLGTVNQLQLYRNGYSISANTYSTSITPATTTNNLALGYRPNAGDFALNARLGKFQIFNKALSDAEVLQNYNAFRDVYGV